MFTNITSFLNESFNKNKSIVIEVNNPDDMKILIKDLESWGYHYDKDFSPDDELYDDMLYPMIVSFSAPELTDEFFIHSPDAYDEVTDEDFEAFNLYGYIEDFYNDSAALSHIKNRKHRITPNYNPRRMDRTLESKQDNKINELIKERLSKGKYTCINFGHTNSSDVVRLQNYFKELGFIGNLQKIYRSLEPGVRECLTIFTIDGPSFDTFYIYGSGEGEHMEDGSFNSSHGIYKVSPIFTTDELIEYIDGYRGVASLMYKPRKIERTLESNNDIHTAIEFCVVLNNMEEYDELTRICKLYGYPEGYTPNGFPHFMFINLKDKTVSFINHQSKHYMDMDESNPNYCLHNVYKRRYTINDLDIIERMLKQKKIIDAPSYAPRKMDRTLESFNIGDYISVREMGRPSLIRCWKKYMKDVEKILIRNTPDIHWINRERGELLLDEISYYFNDYEYYYFEIKKNGELTWADPTEHADNVYCIEIKNDEDFKKFADIKPSYEPRKIIKESLNTNKILWAFDMDDTLVYSKRFEEHIKPLIVKEEFLTPEIILNNKINDIGINIKDLKYENGRVYFDDPKQIVNITNNASWVRKGSRVYITQPDAYFLTEESMPIGVYGNIVNIYNKAENKAIITSRRERLRKQTELALNNLGIQLPNCGLFMYPSDSLVFQAKWKALKLEELYADGFTEIHYFDDNIKVLKRIKSYLKKDNINITLYKVNENNYRKI